MCQAIIAICTIVKGDWLFNFVLRLVCNVLWLLPPVINWLSHNVPSLFSQCGQHPPVRFLVTQNGWSYIYKLSTCLSHSNFKINVHETICSNGIQQYCVAMMVVTHVMLFHKLIRFIKCGLWKWQRAGWRT